MRGFNFVTDKRRREVSVGPLPVERTFRDVASAGVWVIARTHLFCIGRKIEVKYANFTRGTRGEITLVSADAPSALPPAADFPQEFGTQVRALFKSKILCAHVS